MIGVGTRQEAIPQESGRSKRRLAPDEWVGWRDVRMGHLDAEAERPYWIALSLLPGIGPVGFARLLARYGSAQAAWRAGGAALQVLPRQVPDAPLAFKRLARRGVLTVARKVEADVRRAGGVVVIALDADYPRALAEADPRPPVLYRAGEPDAFVAPAVAIVGTRRASGYGRSVTQELADELARAGVTVVSGLALGIDGEAHRAALQAGGRSVAVLPSPLDRIYPPRHRELAAQLVATGGALVSEIAPGNAVGRPDFARRNRIIAGLSQAVVVVEAPDRSGALLTAAAAIQLGRELYAVPGDINADGSRGSNRLIADHHASMVTSAAGLLTAVGFASGGRPLSVTTLSEIEGRVLYRLLEKPGSVEELLHRTDLPTSALASALTLLEARGLVTSYGGATFHPTLAARRIGQAR
ncbi:MAG TPA: DNA-processing protein DprA [Candidatus Limnocylindria bacterium]|nr:DNA-processing protein DprA [Candidatus Limnocylindria bacterium]